MITNRHALAGRAAIAAALALVLAGQAAAQGESPVAAMIDAGRYQEAYAAASSGGQLADPKSLAALARLLLRHSIASPNEAVRWSALRAARSLGDPEIAAAAKPLARDGGRYERSLALEVLANADPVGNRDIFIGSLRSPYRTVRLRALRALSGFRDADLVPLFATVLGEDDDPELRAFAARALGASRSPSAIAPLTTGLEDKMAVVQEESVRALVELGDKNVGALLRQRLEDVSPGDRARVIRLLSLVPDPRLAMALAPYLGNDDAEVRAAAAAAILQVQRPPGAESR